jgi:hypothetical protein
VNASLSVAMKKAENDLIVATMTRLVVKNPLVFDFLTALSPGKKSVVAVTLPKKNHLVIDTTEDLEEVLVIGEKSEPRDTLHLPEGCVQLSCRRPRTTNTPQLHPHLDTLDSPPISPATNQCRPISPIFPVLLPVLRTGYKMPPQKRTLVEYSAQVAARLKVSSNQPNYTLALNAHSSQANASTAEPDSAVTYKAPKPEQSYISGGESAGQSVAPRDTSSPGALPSNLNYNPTTITPSGADHATFSCFLRSTADRQSSNTAVSRSPQYPSGNNFVSKHSDFSKSSSADIPQRPLSPFTRSRLPGFSARSFYSPK